MGFVLRYEPFFCEHVISPKIMCNVILYYYDLFTISIN